MTYTVYTARPLPSHIPERPKPRTASTWAQHRKAELLSQPLSKIKRAIIEVMQDGRERTVDDVHQRIGGNRARIRDRLSELVEAGHLARDTVNCGVIVYRVGGMTDRPIRNLKDNVLDSECMRAGVSAYNVRSPKRWPELVAVRKRVAKRLRDEAGMSLPAIGRILGRHHTTIIHYLREEGW